MKNKNYRKQWCIGIFIGMCLNMSCDKVLLLRYILKYAVEGLMSKWIPIVI